MVPSEKFDRVNPEPLDTFRKVIGNKKMQRKGGEKMNGLSEKSVKRIGLRGTIVLGLGIAIMIGINPLTAWGSLRTSGNGVFYPGPESQRLEGIHLSADDGTYIARGGRAKANSNGTAQSEGREWKNRFRYGPGDGTGAGQGPQDGSGYGAKKGVGTGNCDGTGPKGNSSRKGGR